MNPTPAPSVGTQAIPPYRLPPMNLAEALPDVEGYSGVNDTPLSPELMNSHNNVTVAIITKSNGQQ
jgi:hypothetical protein